MSKITETISSPNQSSRAGYIPQLIVCHIAEGTYAGTKSWFSTTASETSSHFIVAQDGRICQCVPLNKMAWCNGTTTTGDNRDYRKSTVDLVKKLGGNANWYSISIEHEGFYSQTKGKLTDAQQAATAWLIGYIRDQVKAIFGHTIPMERVCVVGHYEINPVTKPCCPGESFPFTALLSAQGTVTHDADETVTVPDVDDGQAVNGIHKNSVVQFTGGSVFSQSDSTVAASTRSASRCEVTKVVKGALRPYHLISLDDALVHGWVSADCVKAVEQKIAVGAFVVVTGTNYATGQKIPSWVKATMHKVSQLKDDRALLGSNGGINSWVYLKDLQVA